MALPALILPLRIFLGICITSVLGIENSLKLKLFFSVLLFQVIRTEMTVDSDIFKFIIQEIWKLETIEDIRNARFLVQVDTAF